MIRPSSILTLVGLVLLTTSPRAPRAEPLPALSLVVSIYPLEMLLREVAAPGTEISTLVPSGASPHTFEPKPSDLVRIARADWFLRAGGGLDDWTERILASAGGRAPVQSLSDWVPAEKTGAAQTRASGHSHDAERADPHTWLDPILVRDQIVPALIAALSAIDPAGRPLYQTRGEAFRERLTALDAEIRDTLRQVQGRRYVAFHNAWRHFAHRYQLLELAVLQEYAGEEPTPREVARLVVAAREAGVPAILVEPQLDPRLARTIAREFGAQTILVDPLGDASRSERARYEALMRFNATAFSLALGGGQKMGQ